VGVLACILSFSSSQFSYWQHLTCGTTGHIAMLDLRVLLVILNHGRGTLVVERVFCPAHMEWNIGTTNLSRDLEHLQQRL
jgi:hypothetical protein